MGVGRWRLWSTFVLLVSLGEGLMCANLRSEGTTCLKDERHGGETTMVISWELCEIVEFRSVGK